MLSYIRLSLTANKCWMTRLRVLAKWLTPGIGVKRWLLLLASGLFSIVVGLTYGLLSLHAINPVVPMPTLSTWFGVSVAVLLGAVLVLIAGVQLTRALLAPYRKFQQGRVIDVVYAHNIRQKGLRVVAIGGGTGLPSVLRGMKLHTSNLTAIVTVADDGGSSGRLRKELGVLPPGDIRNNIAALADDESLMTQLFQYRFDNGDLGGHAFGNLFISALSGVTGSIESALVETGRVLNIQGRVLPATLQDVNLVGVVRIPGVSRPVVIHGESKITEAGGQIERIELSPAEVQAYEESVQAILDADLVILGPGSLYTSILPNLLVKGLAEALRAATAYKIYICNVATQPGETDDYSVAEHVMAMERHIGRGVFNAVLANNAYPVENAGSNTHYVPPVPDNHEILQRYEIRYAALTDSNRPWRHDPHKLVEAILNLSDQERSGSGITRPIFSGTKVH